MGLSNYTSVVESPVHEHHGSPAMAVMLVWLCLSYKMFISESLFTALHEMQTRSSDENSVRPSVCHTRVL